MADTICRNGHTLRMDYIRIERVTGGAAGRRRINAPCIDATIFLTDARAVRTKRAGEAKARREGEWHERRESAGETLNRLCGEPNKEVRIQCGQNEHTWRAIGLPGKRRKGSGGRDVAAGFE